MPGKTTFTSWRMARSLGNETQLPYSRWWRADEPVEWQRVDYAKKVPTRADGVWDINVTVEKGLPPVPILLEKGVRLSGTVSDADGKPVQGVQVGIVSQSGGMTGDTRYTLTTDAQGAFTGYGPAGNGIVYNLCAYLWPEKEAPVATAVSEPFQSKPGDELSFKLKMTKGGWVAGTLRGTDGKSPTDIKVTAIPQDGLEVAYAYRIASPDATGHFHLGPLRPGHYSLKLGSGMGAPLSLLANIPPKEIDIVDGEEKDLGEWTSEQKDGARAWSAAPRAAGAWWYQS